MVPVKQATLLGQASASRICILPFRGTYCIIQEFGCVEENDGYPSSPSCPKKTPNFHDGLDFGAPGGMPILAAVSGTVTFSGIDPHSRSGNFKIVIEHDGLNAGYRAEYLPWERSLVPAGERVTAGQEIAKVGSVGYSNGNHLHSSVYVDASNQAIESAAWLLGDGVSLLPGAEMSDVPPAGVLQ